MNSSKLHAMCSSAPVVKYLKEGSYEPDMIATMQYTVPKNASLSEAGEKLLHETQERYDRGDFKMHCKYWDLDTSNSGRQIYSCGALCLNSFNNKVLIIPTMKNGERRYITTSPIVMYTTQWAVTSSGSLYSLDPEGLRSPSEMEELYIQNEIGECAVEYPSSEPKPRVGIAIGPDGIGLCVKT